MHSAFHNHFVWIVDFHGNVNISIMKRTFSDVGFSIYFCWKLYANKWISMGRFSNQSAENTFFIVKWDSLLISWINIFFILRYRHQAKQHDAEFSHMVESNSSEHNALFDDDVNEVLRELEVFFTSSGHPFIFALNAESLGTGMKTLMGRASSTSIFIPPICDISVLYQCLFNRSNLRRKWFSDEKVISI